MQALGKLIVECYFTPLILYAIQILTVIVSVRNRNKFPELKYFHLYPITSLFQTTIALGSMTIVDDSIDLVQHPSVTVFILVEFLLIYLFYFRTIIKKRDRLVLKILFIGYVSYTIFNWFLNKSFFEYEQPFLVQSIALIIPCLFHFLQLFNVPLGRELISLPTFWVNVSVLFFFSSTIPLFLLVTYFSKYIYLHESLYSINYIAYCIFFLIICKAYLCKTVTRYDYSLS